MLNLIIFFGGCAITLLILAWNAPVGYEDETGFHYGEQNMNIIECQFGSDSDHQKSLNQKTKDIIFVWLSGFLSGFSLMFLLWLWFSRV